MLVLVCLCLIASETVQRRLGEARRQWFAVAEPFFISCAGGEMERQVPSDEILCVASNVS